MKERGEEENEKFRLIILLNFPVCTLRFILFVFDCNSMAAAALNNITQVLKILGVGEHCSADTDFCVRVNYLLTL